MSEFAIDFEKVKPRARTFSKRLNLGKLHVACSEGKAEEVKALLAKPETQLSRKAKRLSQEIVGTPDKEDVYLTAHLPIHTACQRREGSTDIIHILLKDGGYSIMDKTVNDDTALHVACTSGNLEAVRALLDISEPSRIRECLKHTNKDGNLPLHLAAQSGKPEITTLILDQLLPADYKQVLSKANRLGRTCISMAIEADDWTSVKLLLRHAYSNPANLYQDFLTYFPECKLPEHLQALEHEPINAFLLGDSESGKTTLITTLHNATLSILTKIVSSLWSGRNATESFKASIHPLTVEYRKNDHKCPFIFHDVGGHRDYAQEAIFTCARDPLEALYIITADVQRDVEENILYWLNFLFNQLTDYMHCVYTSAVQPYKMKVKVAIALTFCDLVPTSRLQAVSKIDWSHIASHNEYLASQFTWCGNYHLNSRRHNAFNVPQLLSKLHDQCRFSGHLDGPNEPRSMLAQTFILATLLLKEYPNNAVTTFNDVIGLVQRTNSSLCKMLPMEDEEIEKLCHNLSLLTSFKILTFDPPNKRLRRWYIIFDYKYLLQLVEEALVVLSHQSTNGMVTRQQIKAAFHYRPDFVTAFLEHLKLCELVSKEGLECMRKSIRSSKRSLSMSMGSNKSTLDLPNIVIQTPRAPRTHRRTKSESHAVETDDITTDKGLSVSVSTVSSSEVSSPLQPESPMLLDASKLPLYLGKQPSKTSSTRSSRHSSRKATPAHREVPNYFFPSLIPKHHPKVIWDEDATEYTYGFAWSLVPHDGDKWFLSPKFITIVLFRLLFSFAPRPANPVSFVERLCTLWHRGITWSDPLGARVCVAISDDNKITLSMQCLQQYEVPCLSIRNEIMADIKQQLREIHPNIQPRELFIPYDGVNVFPIIDTANSYNMFDKEEIRQAILEKRPVICTKGKHHKPLDALLHFEPLCYLPPPLLKCLLDTDNEHEQISDDFCMHLAKNLSTKWRYLADHFKDTVIRKYLIDSLKGDGAVKNPPYDTAMKMLVHLREVEYESEDARVDTYAGLRQSLFEISIFTPREAAANQDI